MLGAEFFKNPEDAPRFVTKASAFRSLLGVLREDQLFDVVLAHCPAEAQAIMKDPPLPIAFMPAVVFQYVFRALDAEVGLERLRDIARRSVLTGPMKVMRPIIEGTLRMFGASPTAFFRRMSQIMKPQIKGVDFDFILLEEGRATLELTYPYLHDVPDAAFVYWEAVLANTFEICGRHGSARTDRSGDTPDRNRAHIYLEWS